MSSQTVDLGLYKIGDAFCITVPDFITNCDALITDVQVQLTLPAGVAFGSATLDKGSFDPATNIWTVGSMTPSQGVGGEFCFNITDDSLSSYVFTWAISTPSSCTDCFVDDTHTATASGISCNYIASKCGTDTVLIGEFLGNGEASADGDIILNKSDISSIKLTGYSGLALNDDVTISTPNALSRHGYSINRYFGTIQVRGRINCFNNGNATYEIILLRAAHADINYGTDTSIVFKTLSINPIGSMTVDVIYEVDFSVNGAFSPGDIFAIGVYSNGSPTSNADFLHSIQLWGY